MSKESGVLTEDGLRLLRLTEPVTESNCYVVWDHGDCMVIDPGGVGIAEPALQKWNSRPALIALTHGHCDHVGGLEALRRQYPEAMVVCSAACSLEMQDAKENMSRMMETFLYFKSGETRIVPYAPFTCQAADLTFDEELALPFGGGTLTFKRLPGHTAGSAVIGWRGRLFVGDYLLPGTPVITRMPGGSGEAYEECAKPWLSEIPDGTMLFPGHGEPFLMSGEVRRFHGLGDV